MQSKQFIPFSVIIVIVGLSDKTVSSSSYLPQEKCSLKDSACLTREAHRLSKYFINGIPELGVEKMDKLATDNIVINEKGLIFEVKNVEVEGLKNAVIDSVSVNMEYKLMKISLQTTFTITGDYTADGVLFTIPVIGDGRTNMTINKINLDILFFFDIIQNKDGKDVINLIDFTFGFDVIDQFYLHFENTYNGDKEKGEKLHLFLHEYWRIIRGNFGHYCVNAIIDKMFGGLKHDFLSYVIKDFVLL